MASHLIDARGTVEPDVDPKGVESRLRDGVFLWLDIDNPTEADFKLLSDVFKLHPLALKDSRKFGQRPKIEDYDDFTFLVVFGAVDDPESRAGMAPVEVHCFYSPHWLITVHHGECPVFEELRNQSHRHLQRYEEGLGILYLVVDELVDSFLPQLSELDDEIDQLEDTILIDPQPAALQQAIGIKRQLVQLRKIVHPQSDMFAALLSGRYELPGMTPEHERYFRDVYDHLIRVAEQLDDYRDLASRHHRSVPVDRRQQDEPDHEAARLGRDVLPAAHVHHRVLRPELHVLVGDVHPCRSGRSGCSASGSTSPPSSPSSSGSSTASGATCGSACRTSRRCRTAAERDAHDRGLPLPQSPKLA